LYIGKIMSNSSFSGPVRSQNGFQTISVDATTGAVTTTSTLGATSSVTNLTTTNLVFTDINHPSTAAINATATATAAQIATGYITSTSAATTTITLPTGTLLGAALGATAGTVLDFYVDNTAGASTVTIAVATNGILSAAAAAGSSANFGLLTVPSGVTGLARFTIMFSSATAYVFSRTA
jgi:hypothetical protein